LFESTNTEQRRRNGLDVMRQRFARIETAAPATRKKPEVLEEVGSLKHVGRERR
jgi:hypothetical protein